MWLSTSDKIAPGTEYHTASVQYHVADCEALTSQTGILDRDRSAFGYKTRLTTLNGLPHVSHYNTMTEYTHIVNGKPVTSPTTLDVLNPGTQQKIAEVPVATKEQVFISVLFINYDTQSTILA